MNLEQLFSETVSTLMRLDASEEKRETLERLVKLLETVKGMQDSMGAAMAPSPAPEESPVQPPTVQGPTGPLPLDAGPPPAPSMNAPVLPAANQPGVPAA